MYSVAGALNTLHDTVLPPRLWRLHNAGMQLASLTELCEVLSIGTEVSARASRTASASRRPLASLPAALSSRAGVLQAASPLPPLPGKNRRARSRL